MKQEESKSAPRKVANETEGYGAEVKDEDIELAFEFFG